jgi:hypothetical protein
MGNWTGDYPNKRGTVTISQEVIGERTDDLDPSDARRIVTIQNTSSGLLPLGYCCLSFGIKPSVNTTSGRAVGDMTLVRESNTASTFYLSAFQGATYRDIARFGHSNSYVRGWLKVGANSSANAPLDVQGDSLLRGNVGVTSSFCVSGSTTLQGPLTVNSTAGIAGGMNVSGVVNAYGSMNVVGALTASGSTTLNNGLGVKGTATLGTLNVSGLLTNTGGFTATNPGNSTSLSISPGNAGGNSTSGFIQYDVVGTTGTHFFWDNMQVTGSLRADGAMYANGGLTVSGGLLMYNAGTGISVTPGYAGGNATSGYVQYNIPGTGTHYFWNNAQVTGKLTAAAVQTSYATFSVTGTGSDTNIVTINIPNPTTTQRTTIDINYAHAAFSSHVYQGYISINSADSMIANLYKARGVTDSGFVVQDNSLTAYPTFATNVRDDTDVHLRLEVYKRLSSTAQMAVSAEYSYSITYIPTKVIGNVIPTLNNTTISSVTLRTSTSSGYLVAGSYTMTQTGVP